MKITVFNLKGGQGKTTLSLALALQYGFLVVTNDEYSPLEKVLEKGKSKTLREEDPLPKVPNEVPLIYDFGGRPDRRVLQAAKASDWVLIPIIFNSPLDMQTSIKTARELEKTNNNIIFVINRTQKGDFEAAEKILQEFFSYPIFEIKQSKAFINMVNEKKSIECLMSKNTLFGYHYKKPFEQLQTLHAFLQK